MTRAVESVCEQCLTTVEAMESTDRTPSHPRRSAPTPIAAARACVRSTPAEGRRPATLERIHRHSEQEGDRHSGYSKYAGWQTPVERQRAYRLVLEARHAGVGLGRALAAIEELALEGGEQALGHRVVVALAHRSDRRNDAHLAAACAERIRRILAPLVRVMDDAVGTTLPQRHVQRLKHELGAQRMGYRPPPGG